ncbi:hypothetical protein P8452_00839 [Trifolium repens]|nr:hypothetical protein P8452_00839 [Trifolium repens]
MRRALNKVNLGESHISENLKSPNSDDKRLRFERRWKRQDARNDSLKHNRVATAKRKTASNHSGRSNIGVNVSNINGSDEVDPDYALFLNSVTIIDGDEEYMRVKNTTNTSVAEDGRNSSKIYGASNHNGGSNVGVGNSNGSDEVDPDYALFLNSVTIVDDDEEYMRVKNTTNTSVREDGRNTSKIDNASNHGGGSNIGVVVGNSNDSDEVDPDYALFLNSVTIVDSDEEYMRVKNITDTSKVDNRSNSSNSDLIVLESYPTRGNTPFVPSKIYDSSWFGEKMNPKDNVQMPAYDDSDFRRRLVECLHRPYDRREYKELINKLCNKNQKERDSEGVITPYHKMYPDIAKAITEVSKERAKVLFHLRGFFFWLENLSHMGSFQPWHDESCMKLLRKL